MIEVLAQKQGERVHVRVDGHADYALSGQDIVCAAISALTYCLAAGADRFGELLQCKEKDGFDEVQAEGSASTVLYEAFLSTVREIERQYPQNVRLNVTDKQWDSD